MVCWTRTSRPSLVTGHGLLDPNKQTQFNNRMVCCALNKQTKFSNILVYWALNKLTQFSNIMVYWAFNKLTQFSNIMVYWALNKQTQRWVTWWFSRSALNNQTKFSINMVQRPLNKRNQFRRSMLCCMGPEYGLILKELWLIWKYVSDS